MGRLRFRFKHRTAAAPPLNRRRKVELQNVLAPLVSYDELENLPDGSLIFCDVDEADGTRLLINDDSVWGEFEVIDNEIILTQCYTPLLPGILVIKPELRTESEVKPSHLKVVK